MPVMTKGIAKNISQEMLYETGTRCCISNSFILTLKPGTEFIKKMGGIKKLANWKGGLFMFKYRDMCGTINAILIDTLHDNCEKR
jgi:tRNA-guanine family transglycosylase